MMRDYHPLGIPTHAGKCVKYFIKSEVYGVLGGFSFHAAGWSDKSRDDFIGWSPEARLTQNNIRLLINNSRFLILPGIRVKNLASWVLGRIRLRVSSDWDERYGDRPVYMFTYVNPKTHSGACYKGAGWDKMGETSGRRDQDNVSKLIFGCSLAENACETLCYTSKKSRFDFHHDTYVPEEAPWYEKEFGGSTHPDGRIQKRILKVGRGWCSRPGASFGEKFPERAEQEGAIRLLSNKSVTKNHLLEPHQKATVKRVHQQKVIFTVNDTTTLNLGPLKKVTSRLSSIGGKSTGIMAHVGAAFSEEGNILGCLDVDGDFRPRCKEGREKGEKIRESVRWIEGLELARDLAHVCPNTKTVYLADREAGIGELFLKHDQCRKNGTKNLEFLVRSKDRNITLSDGGKPQKLRRYMKSLEPMGTKTVNVRDANRRKITATVSLRIARVKITPPKESSDSPRPKPIEITAVLAEFTTGPKKGDDWLLLSSEKEVSFESAKRLTEWYSKRWKIEEFFRMCKTGSKIESQHRFDESDDFVKCLTLDLITAFRVASIEYGAKYSPDVPAHDFISTEEFAGLSAAIQVQKQLRFASSQLTSYHKKYLDNSSSKHPPPPELSVGELCLLMGRIVGFRPSKRQPLPGYKIIWRGFNEMMNATRYYKAAKVSYHKRD